MTTFNVFESMKNGVSRFPRPYAEGRSRQAALAAYATPTAVLDALQLLASTPQEERGAIVVALINEQQRASHPLWQGLLVSAFGPMLRRVRARLKRQGDEDLDQHVLLAFLGAVTTMPASSLTSYAPIALRRMTEEAAFSKARTDKRNRKLHKPFDETKLRCDPFAPELDPRAEEERLEKLATLLTAAAEGDEEVRAMLVATCADDESLTAYVARVYAAHDAEQRVVTYERLRSARRRVVLRLRPRIAALRAAA